MHKLMPFCAILLLSSCASPLKSTLGLNEVAVKVTEPCIEAKDIPVMPPTAMRPDADVAALSAGADADIRELRRVVRRQNVLLTGCAQPGGK